MSHHLTPCRARLIGCELAPEKGGPGGWGQGLKSREETPRKIFSDGPSEAGSTSRNFSDFNHNQQRSPRVDFGNYSSAGPPIVGGE